MVVSFSSSYFAGLRLLQIQLNCVGGLLLIWLRFIRGRGVMVTIVRSMRGWVWWITPYISIIFIIINWCWFFNMVSVDCSDYLLFLYLLLFLFLFIYWFFIIWICHLVHYFHRNLNLSNLIFPLISRSLFFDICHRFH